MTTRVCPRSHPLIGAMLVVLLTGLTTLAEVERVQAADASSDIPGIELPGPVAAGRLGGDVYDVVYRLTVPAGHVILASLTGTDGTDFDMYLFDGTASTVLSNTGLLTKSTSDDSSEAISWPSRQGGTYYIDLNGATDVEGDYRLTVQTLPDPTPPTVSIVVGDGKAVTNQLAISVRLSTSEDLSGVTEMAFSADGITFGAWEPFQGTATSQVPPGDGTKTIWAKVRNGVGLESQAASDSIELDRAPPSVIRIEPQPSTTVANLRPKFQVTFNEAVLAASWKDLGLIVQAPDGTLLTGTYSYDVAMRTGSFLPSESMSPGASYVVTIGLVRDLAGNPVAPLSSWSVTPLMPTALTVVTAGAPAKVGGSVGITVALAGAPRPATVEMLASSAGGAFEPVSSFELASGSLSFLIAPQRNTTYRFRYSGGFGIASAQADATVLVRRSVSLVGRVSATVARAAVGRSISLVAAVSPAARGLSVSFKLYRFDSGRRVWVYAGSKGRMTTSDGRATLIWTPPSSGSYYWRVSVAPTIEFANNTSAVYRWTVVR